MGLRHRRGGDGSGFVDWLDFLYVPNVAEYFIRK